MRRSSVREIRMKHAIKSIVLILFCLSTALVGKAQCRVAVTQCAQPVPHLVKFSGTIRNISQLPRSGVVSIRFVMYGEASGGTPLWQEVQNTQVDQQGHYEVMLGATGVDGLPVELFSSGESRWLDAQPLLPGEEEQPRILMVSVPYALQAENAQTLGGLPVSAFAKAAASTGVVNNLTSATASESVTALAGSGVLSESTPAPSSAKGALAATGTTNTIPKFSASGTLLDSQITDQNGVVSMQNLSNTVFADQFTGGVSAAISACPANGCIIYAVSPSVNLNLGTLDPGFKSITIYLGPYTYTVNQITLRKGFKIIGMGASGGINGSVACSAAAPCNGTTLQSINGNNPVFVIPQTNNDPATNVLLSGFRLYGSAGNTSEDGFFLDTSSTSNTGLWSSVFDDVSLQGFAGTGIHVRGRSDNFSAASQWLLFNNVVVFRTPGGGNALRLEGAVFELRFRNCEFDGQGMGDGTNIYIGGRAGGTGGYPTSIVFEGLVSQQAALAVQIDGGVNLLFYGSHHEALSGGYQLTDITNIGNWGVTISDSYFAGNVGINGGAGFGLNVATTNSSGIVFVHNQIFGTPDSIVKSTNFASVIYKDNFSHSPTTQVPATSGLSTQMSPAAAIDIQGIHSIGLNPSTTPITTIQSGLGPGEMVTFFTLGGPVTFSTGGNIDLMGMSSLTLNGTITFVRSDLGGLFWKPVSQWSPTATSTAASSASAN